MAITYRDDKGENLTPAEVDTNFRTLKEITDELISNLTELSAALDDKLNSDGTAADSNMLNGNTLSEILGIVNGLLNLKVDKNADCDLLPDSSFDLLTLSLSGDYFIPELEEITSHPLDSGATGEAWVTFKTYQDAAIMEFTKGEKKWYNFKTNTSGTYHGWVAIV